jgi:hypothetical protein
MPTDRTEIMREVRALEVRREQRADGAANPELDTEDRRLALELARKIVASQFDSRQIARIDSRLLAEVSANVRQIMSAGLTKSQRALGEANRYFEPLSAPLVRDH